MADELIVVGGGAAGMMAAISAAETGAAVRLLERNPKVGAQAVHHRQGPVQRDQPLSAGGGAGQHAPERPVPLRGRDPYAAGVGGGLFHRPGGPAEGRAGQPGLSGVGPGGGCHRRPVFSYEKAEYPGDAGPGLPDLSGGGTGVRGGDRLRLLSLPGCGPGHWRLLLSGHRLYRRRI